MSDREPDDPADDIVSARGEIILYPTEDGRSRVECRFEGGTLWLSQGAMIALYQIDKSNVSRHLRAIFAEGELDEKAVVAYFATTGLDGKTYQVGHYHLDAVIAVGYRVRSARGTQFRQWATERLREYLVKGFTMDDERLKNPPGPGVPDHFDELLERIRDIRASERRVYLRVREIFALAADYRPGTPETVAFFQTMQNKLHFAATGKTAPELIQARADSTQPNMGLRTWKGQGVRKGDVTVAKNYLNEDEITELNRIVVMFLDYAEDQTRRRKQIYMHEWPKKLDAFLAFNERSVLPGPGKWKREDADAHAEREYERFAARRRAVLEQEAETEALKQLEEVARRLPKGTADAAAGPTSKRRANAASRPTSKKRS
ncbi:2-hydroxyacid dehydrogenase [Sorangium cellulosum]|uniref:2-hydroxyacid dehydrogenase n=1 Tax=Sorangium cellulosum TaxID=56 RepID=A0A4P2PZD8_SORCE|nr:virulence RhuM family protein [Sorangium cellulosum]AUX22091.1 2-hydroxyacid dehydrogenase [Sorangium cellulosum]